MQSVNMSTETYFRAIVPIGALFAGLHPFSGSFIPDRQAARLCSASCVMLAGTLWLGNAAYLYLSVSFIQVRPASELPGSRFFSSEVMSRLTGPGRVQMLKALMPVAVFTVGCFFGTESFSVNALCNMVVVTAGVAIASYGEINLVWVGVFLQLLSVATESTRLTLVGFGASSDGAAGG